MLDDKNLDSTASQLAEIQIASQGHHENLTQLIQQYTALVDDYKGLKSDYEEARESRDRYKQMARGQERNPFVLVLIDGDGYVFDNDLVSNGTEGGQKAAELLNKAVKADLQHRGLDNCRVVVRVYANLAGLSKALYKSHLAGPEKRSLTPFVASFNRSNELFDFVDAGELKEGADFKIRAIFRQFAESVQCRHIYFACCHDVGYLSELTPYLGNRDRITLVRTPIFHNEFSKLGFRVEDFPNVFRSTPLETQPTIMSSSTKGNDPLNVSAVKSPGITVCSHFLRGKCAYGANCHFLHPKSNGGASVDESSASGPAGIDNWRVPNPNGKSIANRNDGGINQVPTDVDFGRMLPQADDSPEDKIAVNKNKHRLDAYIPPIALQTKAALKARIAAKKLCNNYHLNGSCPNGDDCEYDHDPISREMLDCLKQVATSRQCPRRGACRNLGCSSGHICQNSDCIKRGGKAYCKIDVQSHYQALEVAEYVQGTGKRYDVAPSGVQVDANSGSEESFLLDLE